ncbi:RHO protein GDP dissociation inhibitor [Colletotrichum orchidophilum]|uniref:RHO protein GDP dissociation inhibitor n=1 Tax=Colletotrichum orchidophilum TaxID=1209926 RepID=A0A1G4BGI7_9PEZI|nr:RHO protein GDP dissociation inhibitor [Colletotrichum orchidophilum]OHF00423.1 RHO protein GDP dissociation inhibitor [Colletotrichum orchidophilum]
MASHEQEDTMPEETQGYKLSQPKQSLAEYQKMGMRRMMQRRNRNNALINRNSIELPPAPLSTPSGSRSQSFKMTEERHLHRARALSRPVPPNPPNSPRLQENVLTQDPNLIRDFYTSPLVVRAAHGLTVFEPLEEYERRDELPTNRAPDENDESLQRYKESLGLGGGKDLSDASDPRVCIILSLTMESPGRDPVTIDLAAPGSEATLKDKPFKIKEGAKFTMVAKFKVQHEILSGLQYVQVVKRKGIKVSKDSEMLGSYAPNTDKQTTYTKRFQEEDAPSGMLARGHYNAISSFVDDDKKTHLTFEWAFDIAKDW